MVLVNVLIAMGNSSSPDCDQTWAPDRLPWHHSCNRWSRMARVSI